MSNLRCPECYNTLNIAKVSTAGMLEEYTPNLCPCCGYQFSTGKSAILLRPETKQHLVNFLLTKIDGEGYSDFIETALRMRSPEYQGAIEMLADKLKLAVEKRATELKEIT